MAAIFDNTVIRLVDNMTPCDSIYFSLIFAVFDMQTFKVLLQIIGLLHLAVGSALFS